MLDKIHKVTAKFTGYFIIFKNGITGNPTICDIDIYNISSDIIVIPINLYFSLDFFFSSFSKLSTPRLSNPAFAINFSKSSTVYNFSSYSILALFITRFTVAFTPSCLFKYFSRPVEHALQVIPSIFNNTFFKLLSSLLGTGQKFTLTL